MVIVGYDEYNTYLYDPATGQISPYGMNDSTALFESAGNVFLTYIETSQSDAYRAGRMKAKAMGLQKDGKTGVPVWHKSKTGKTVLFSGKSATGKGKKQC